jgi:hypothetical protein
MISRSIGFTAQATQSDFYGRLTRYIILRKNLLSQLVSEYRGRQILPATFYFGVGFR